MKEKFTAAPWIAKEENGGFIEIVDKADRLILQIMSDGPAAKKSKGEVPAAEAAANTQLVLASAQLYTALKEQTKRIIALKAALEKKDLEFSIVWLDDGVINDAQAALEAAVESKGV